MKKMYDLIAERLNAKRTELSERQDQFDAMWHNEKTPAVLKETQSMICLSCSSLNLRFRNWSIGRHL